MNKTILINGMQRSGSTWLYNAVRHIVASYTKPENMVFGWHSDLENIKSAENSELVTIIKCHGVIPRLLDRANVIIYSYRDIRDVLASKYRMWHVRPTIHDAHILISECRYFETKAHYIMRYERMIQDQLNIIMELIDILSAKIDIPGSEIDPEIILNQCATQKQPATQNKSYNVEDLYHIGHITNGQPMEFFEIVPIGVLKDIEKNYRQWFDDYEYKLVTF